MEQEKDSIALLIDRWVFDNSQGKWMGTMIFGSENLEQWSNSDYLFYSTMKPVPESNNIIPSYNENPTRDDKYGLNLNIDGICEYIHEWYHPLPTSGTETCIAKVTGSWEVKDDLLVLYFYMSWAELGFAPVPASVPLTENSDVFRNPNRKIMLRYIINGNKLILSTHSYERLN